MSEQYSAVILAAGEGKRMKSNRPKVLSEVLFKPMLRWVLDAVRGSYVADVCCVAGHRHEQVEEYLAAYNAQNAGLPPVQCVLQKERRGTGHAVMMARAFLEARRGGHVLVLNGDAPFMTPHVIDAALRVHLNNGNAATVISAAVDDPTGYGRIVRDSDTGLLRAIVEQKDADWQTQQIHEINSGSYWFCTDDLLDVLSRITSDNAQGEYYLTDAIRLLIESGRRASAYTAKDPTTVLGANDCKQLNELNAIAREKILERHMTDGVSIPCIDGVLIGPDVKIGHYTTILPGTILCGDTVIGENCMLGPNTFLQDTKVGADAILNSVQVYSQTLADKTELLPFSVLK